MVKPTKIVALALVAVLVMGAVAGVAYWSVGYDPNKVDPGLYVDGSKVESTGTIITVDGHEVDFNVYRYVYMTNKYSMTMYYGDDIFDHDPDGSMGDYVKEYADESLRQWYAWIDIGEEIGITADAELLQEVEDEIAEDKALYGAQFESNLAENYLADEETYRQVITIQKLVANVQEAYTEHVEAESGDELLAGIATAQHILITAEGFAEREEEYEALMTGTTIVDDVTDETAAEAAGDAEEGAEDEFDAEGVLDELMDEVETLKEAVVEGELPADEADATTDETPEDAATGDEAEDAAANEDVVDEDTADEDPGAEDETAGDEADKDEEYYSQRAKVFADWIVEQIRDSSDPIAAFEEYRLEYDEDPGQQAEGYTAYTFAAGTMVDEFYEGALALDVNEISDPVETSYGYHILLRLPLDEQAVEDDGLVDSAVSNLVSERFNERYEAQEISYGEYYSYIEPATLR